MSNLRPAPMFLRPSVVRQLINDTREIRKGMAQLQLLPLRLVDQPTQRPEAEPESELVRFDTEHGPALNDDEANPVEADATGEDSEPAAGTSTQAAESEPVQSPFTCNGAALDWPDAPLPEHADPDLDRPEPTPADDAGAIASEPAPVNGFALMRSRATSAPAAVEARPVETLRNLGRRRAPRSEVTPAGGRAEVIRAVAKQLQARQVAKNVDWSRVADAHRAKPPASKARPAPTVPAPSRDACPRCGIPGWRGCDHFLPCEEDLRPPPSPSERRKDSRMHHRHKEGA